MQILRKQKNFSHRLAYLFRGLFYSVAFRQHLLIEFIKWAIAFAFRLILQLPSSSTIFSYEEPTSMMDLQYKLINRVAYRIFVYIM